MNSSTECEDSVTYAELNLQGSRRPGIKDQQPDKKKPKTIFIVGFVICLLLPATAVIVFLSQKVLSSKCCPEEWIRLDTSCYYLSSHKATCEESKSNCSSMGAHLAVIEDNKELMLLIRQIRISESFWIGLIKSPQDIRSWTDKPPFNPNLQPLDNKDKQNCECVRDERIKPENCKSKQHWICERQTEN